MLFQVKILAMEIPEVHMSICPLVYRKGNQEGEPWYQVGIVSFGTMECGIGSPGIYTRVTAYLDWIAEHLKP